MLRIRQPTAAICGYILPTRQSGESGACILGKDGVDAYPKNDLQRHDLFSGITTSRLRDLTRSGSVGTLA